MPQLITERLCLQPFRSNPVRDLLADQIAQNVRFAGLSLPKLIPDEFIILNFRHQGFNLTRLRITHVIPTPDGGGAERLVRELTAKLPNYGVSASALYYHNPRNIELTAQEESLELNSVCGLGALRPLARALDHRKGTKEHIVHGHLTWPLYHLSLLASHIDSPLIFTEHNTHNRRREHRLLRPLERWVYGHYDCLACISEGTRLELQYWLNDDELTKRMRTIQNGSRLLPLAERKARPNQSARLVSVGSLTTQKGFDVALRAVATLSNEIEEYTIVGEGPERTRLEALVHELGLEDKVRLPGYCDDITPYLHTADLGLIPSRWEGFGLVAVEALSTGLPLVASDVPGLREVLAGCNAALLASPSDVTQWEEQIRFGIDQLTVANHIAYSARAHAEQFTTDAMVSRYADLYKEIANAY